MPLTDFETNFNSEQALAECQTLVDKGKHVSNRDLFLFIRNVIWLRADGDWRFTFRADFPLITEETSGILHLGYIPSEDHPANTSFLELFLPGTTIGHSYFDAISVQLNKETDQWEHIGINRYKSPKGTERFVCHVLMVEELNSTLAGGKLYGEDRVVPIQLFPDQGLEIVRNIWGNHLKHSGNLPLDSFGQPVGLFVRRSVVNAGRYTRN